MIIHHPVEQKERRTREGFEQVISQLEAARARQSRARVIGITACRSGDGASFVLGNLAQALAGKSRRGVLLADCSDLILASHLEPADLLAQCASTEDAGLWLLSVPERSRRSSIVDALQTSRVSAAMPVLASRFDYVLLDCGAANTSGDMWKVASVLDDVFLVVAAGETKREQILYAQRILTQAGAPLAGCILNKRTYPLPGVLHRWFA